MDAYIAQWIGSRPKQEDAYCVRHFPTGTLAVVCDGMGGHDAGAAAATLAAETFAESFAEYDRLPLGTRLLSALDAANEAVGDYFAEHGGFGGTTLVAVFAGHGLLRWVSVGDSALRLLRRGRLVRLNEDHSMRGLMRACSGNAKADCSEGHMLRSAVTGEEIALTDAPPMPFPLLPGDCLLISTDGADDVLERGYLPPLHEPGLSPAAAVVEQCRLLASPVADNVTVVSLCTE